MENLENLEGIKKTTTLHRGKIIIDVVDDVDVEKVCEDLVKALYKTGHGPRFSVETVTF